MLRVLLIGLSLGLPLPESGEIVVATESETKPQVVRPLDVRICTGSAAVQEAPYPAPKLN